MKDYRRFVNDSGFIVHYPTYCKARRTFTTMVYIPWPIYAYYFTVSLGYFSYSYYKPIKRDLQSSTKTAIQRTSTNKMRYNKWESVIFHILVGMIRMALSLSLPCHSSSYQSWIRNRGNWVTVPHIAVWRLSKHINLHSRKSARVSKHNPFCDDPWSKSVYVYEDCNSHPRATMLTNCILVRSKTSCRDIIIMSVGTYDWPISINIIISNGTNIHIIRSWYLPIVKQSSDWCRIGRMDVLMA